MMQAPMLRNSVISHAVVLSRCSATSVAASRKAVSALARKAHAFINKTCPHICVHREAATNSAHSHIPMSKDGMYYGLSLPEQWRNVMSRRFEFSVYLILPDASSVRRKNASEGKPLSIITYRHGLIFLQFLDEQNT
eukprot:6178575-Pleurochrysis_carterae.AAC.3